MRLPPAEFLAPPQNKAMDDASNIRTPGDIILDRYMPDATPEQREEARNNLNLLARAYIRIISRLIAEGKESGLDDAALPDDKM
jgi:hypothetical protein